MTSNSVYFRSPNSVAAPLQSPGAARSRAVCASSSQIVMDKSASDTSNPTVVEVDLGNRSYPIYIGSELLDQPHLLQRCASLLYHAFIVLCSVCMCEKKN